MNNAHSLLPLSACSHIREKSLLLIQSSMNLRFKYIFSVARNIISMPLAYIPKQLWVKPVLIPKGFCKPTMISKTHALRDCRN